MKIKEKWNNHLQENNMTYIEHMAFAMFYSCYCLMAGIYLAIHALLPCFFQTAGSDLISKLSERFKNRF